jgi:hypothetical protein
MICGDCRYVNPSRDIETFPVWKGTDIHIKAIFCRADSSIREGKVRSWASEKIAPLTDEFARSIEAKMEVDAIESPVDRISTTSSKTAIEAQMEGAIPETH